MKHNIYAVIGRGYGDEGKGLATDMLCLNNPGAVVVKHNGGGQAGHTVDMSDSKNKRFIFHQLGSGSFRGADTFWASSYYPDLYKLSEEYDSFFALSGLKPVIYADPSVSITTISDVLLNLSIETIREKSRHGSCGMGINEADLRSKAGFGITLSEVLSLSQEGLFRRLKSIRDDYYPNRFKELGISILPDEYADLFFSDEVLSNFATQVTKNSELVTPVSAETLLPLRENIIFESGQGLLLDAMCERNYPHVTASRTGLTNIMCILDKCDLKLDEVIYVTRSYVTRHGAGPLPNEVSSGIIGQNIIDKTNMPNPWQGSLRYGLYDSVRDFSLPVCEDLAPYKDRAFIKSLLITHLNESGNMIKCKSGDIAVSDYIKTHKDFDKVYTSHTPYAEDITL